MASTSFKIEPILNNRIKKEQDIYNNNNEEQSQEAMGLSEYNDLLGMNFETECKSMSNIYKAEVIDSFSTNYNSESRVKLEDSDQKNLLLNNPSVISDPYLRPTDSCDYDEQKIDISEVTVGYAIKTEKQFKTIIRPSSVLDPQTGQKIWLMLKELTIPLVDFKYNFQPLNSGMSQDARSLSGLDNLSGMNFKTKSESMSYICKAEVIDSESKVELGDIDQKNLLLNNNPKAVSDSYLRSADSDEQKIDISEVTVGSGGVSSFHQECLESEIKIEKKRKTIIRYNGLLDPQSDQKVLLKELTIPLVDFKYNLQLLNSKKHLCGKGDLTTNLARSDSSKSSKIAIHKNNLSPTKSKTNAIRFRKRYDCPSCLKSFEKQNLQYHILSNHSDDHNLLRMIKSKTYDCPKCTRKFICKYQLDRHVWGNHKDDKSLLKTVSTKTHRCVKCSKNFFVKSLLDSHIINNHTDDQRLLKTVSSTIYNCLKCSKPFVIKADLKRHLKSAHSIGENVLKPVSSRNSCAKCKKQFSRKKTLDAHIIASHNDDQHFLNMISSKIHTCPKCSKRFVQKSGLDYHIIKDHNNKGESALKAISNCPKCKKQFSRKNGLNRHIIARHYDDQHLLNWISSKTQYICPKCSKRFNKKARLDYHTIKCRNKNGENMVKPTSSRNYCPKCKKQFRQKAGLDGHIIVSHNDDQRLLNIVSCKIHTCPKCSKRFIQKARLDRHIFKDHSNEGEHIFNPTSSTNCCPKCKKQFATKTTLDGHIIVSHNDDQHLLNMISSKTHSCPKCSKRFVQKGRFDYHIMKDHNKDRQLLNMISIKFYECHRCSKRFTNRYDITRHLACTYALTQSKTCFSPPLFKYVE